MQLQKLSQQMQLVNHMIIIALQMVPPVFVFRNNAMIIKEIKLSVIDSLDTVVNNRALIP